MLQRCMRESDRDTLSYASKPTTHHRWFGKNSTASITRIGLLLSDYTTSRLGTWTLEYEDSRDSAGVPLPVSRLRSIPSGAIALKTAYLRGPVLFLERLIH
jgi:hypothetical protein